MPSYNVYSGDKSVLAAKINSTQTTGITIAAMNINGALTHWANTAGVIEVSEQADATLKREWIYYTGSSVAATTNIATLSGVVRGISSTTSDVTSGGTGVAFSKGATVRFVTFHDLLNKKANLDRANSWSAAQTIATGGSIIFTNTTTEGFVSQRLTTAERDAVSSWTDGAAIYNTTLSQMQWREGGAWVTNAAGGSVADGSTIVAGKYEEATVAEQGTAAATGSTGARLVVANANLVKTSSGAGDENKLAVLGASGTLAVGFLGTGTPSASNLLLGDGSFGSVPTAALPGVMSPLFATGADGAKTIAASEDLNPASQFSYTTFTLDAGQTLSVSSVNTPLVIRTLSDVTINGTINLSGKGGPGGDGGGTSGVSGTAGNALFGAPCGGGGGGAAASSSQGASGGSGASTLGNGGAGTAVNGGTPGAAGVLNQALMSHLHNLGFGVACGGGGGGAAVYGGTGNNGVAGGGALAMFVGGDLTLGADSVINVSGLTGSGSGANKGGDGGSGSALILVAGSITDNGVALTGGVNSIVIYSMKDGTLITA